MVSDAVRNTIWRTDATRSAAVATDAISLTSHSPELRARSRVSFNAAMGASVAPEACSIRRDTRVRDAWAVWRCLSTAANVSGVERERLSCALVTICGHRIGDGSTARTASLTLVDTSWLTRWLARSSSVEKLLVAVQRLGETANDEQGSYRPITSTIQPNGGSGAMESSLPEG